MQGLSQFIPTKDKVAYLNQLLKVGFDTLDAGSFVSAKTIPQMADSFEVINQLDLSETETAISVIVANSRGAEDAANLDAITYVGYPFSVSETFQKRNTNCGFEESLARVDEIKNICECNGKEFVIYISMAFGNPYGDIYDVSLVEHWIDTLIEMDITKFSISDTIGVATPELIQTLFSQLNENFPKIGFGAHFHTTPDTWEEKVNAAWEVGCNRFDGAIKGFGGCPMAKDKLTGNMPTENLLAFFEQRGIQHNLDKEQFLEAMSMAKHIFGK